MTSTLDASTEQTPISFKDPSPPRRRGWNDYDDEDQFGIWSCKFSADGKEVIAGGSSMIFGMLRPIWQMTESHPHTVYDLVADRRTVKIAGHSDDVNSCCWADTASGNVLISGSDDTFVKVWYVDFSCNYPAYRTLPQGSSIASRDQKAVGGAHRSYGGYHLRFREG